MVVFALVWLGLFALVYTAGAAFEIWPELPAGAFQDAELVAGFAGLAALVVVLARRRGSTTASGSAPRQSAARAASDGDDFPASD